MVRRTFAGPTRPGTDKETFRTTGRSVPRSGGGGGVSGPVRPQTDEELFRLTGQSLARGSAEAISARAEFERKQAEVKKQAEQKIASDKRAESKRIEKLRSRKVFEARKSFQKDMKTIRTNTQRNQRRQELAQELQNAKDEARVSRLERGIITGFKRGQKFNEKFIRTSDIEEFKKSQPTRENLRLIQNELPKGEVLLFNSRTNVPLGIQSNLLKRTIPFTDAGLKFYENKIAQLPASFIPQPETRQSVIPKPKTKEQKIIGRIKIFKIITAPMPSKETTEFIRNAFGKISRGTFRQLEKAGFDKPKIIEVLTLTKLNNFLIDKTNLSPFQKRALKKVSKFEKRILVGALEEVEENPSDIIVMAFLGGAAPKILAKLGASKLLIKALSKVSPKIKRQGASAVSKLLLGTYFASAGVRVVTAEDKAKKIGRIAVGEVIPFQVGTRFGVKGLLRDELKKELEISLKGMSKPRQEAFKDYMKQTEIFDKYEPLVKNIKLNNIENLPTGKQGEITQKVIRQFLKDEGVIIGGSVAQTGQLGGVRRQGDIDGYKEFSKKVLSKKLQDKFTDRLANKLAKKLRDAGVERVTVLRGEARIGGKKSIEFHDISRIRANIEQVTPNWANWRRYIIKTPEGILIQRIGLQARRKLVASFADPKRLATGKYAKDLKDFKFISDKIFKEAVRKSRNAFFFRKKKLKALGKLFKRKIPKLKKIKKVKVKKKIKRFKKPKKLKKVTKAPKKAKVKGRITKVRKKAKVIRGKGIKKISKKIKFKKVIKLKVKKLKLKKIKRKKTKPSQKPVKKKKIKVKPSQPPRRPKKPKRFPPSQPPRKPKKVPIIVPPHIPRPRRDPPSQPPTPPTKKRKFPPPKIPTPDKTPSKKVTTRKLIIGGFIPVKLKTLKTKALAFAVDIKIKGKWVRQNEKPLTLTNARDVLSWKLDKTLARSGRIRGLGKSKIVAVLPNRVRGYYSKVKTKLRPFKIKRGVRKALTREFIEKRAFVGDTKSEIQLLQKARKLKPVKKKLIKKLRRPIKRKPRKIVKRKPVKKIRRLKSKPKKIVKKPIKKLKKKRTKIVNKPKKKQAKKKTKKVVKRRKAKSGKKSKKKS